MELWRISNYQDLLGSGGMRASGRWHSRGRPVVYLADHPSTALLESLVRLDQDLIPDTYTLLRVLVPDHLSIRRVEPTALPADWRDRPILTRGVGDRWLREASGPIMHVPSAISHAASNFLLNPLHPAAQEVRIIEVIKAPFDPRLMTRPELNP